ncbi:MAG TPA: amidase [Candidatus Dormibacteraeota bacterium]|nr:amidase [Candidatus Dormibacteraeota bacterium]
MRDDSLIFRSAPDLASLIRSGRISSEAVVAAHLGQIERYNPRLRAIVTLERGGVLAQARAADRMLASRSEPIGPLHGVPMTIKDAFRVKGSRSTYGLPQYRNYLPTDDCELVRRIRAAGAVILGRTNVPFSSFDWNTKNPLFGETVNPWVKERTPGGSSGGSAAALAAGFTPLEIGSDLAGSIRYPAHCCGVLGLRTTDGLLPIADIGPEDRPTAFTHLTVAGPMARDLDGLRLLLGVLAERSIPPRERMVRTDHQSLKIHVSFSLAGLEPDPQTRQVLRDLSSRLSADGHSLTEGEPSFLDVEQCWSLWGIVAGYEFNRAVPGILKTALGRFLLELYLLDYRLGSGPLTQAFKTGLRASRARYEEALAEMEDVRVAADRFFEQCDLWIAPVSPSVAFRRQSRGSPIHMGGERIAYTHFNGTYLAPTAVPGTPALAIPVGAGESGLPISVQVHGKRGRDFELLDLVEAHFSQYISLPSARPYQEH